MSRCLLFCVLALVSWSVSAESNRLMQRKQLYYWVWWRNLEDHWQDFIDFTAEQRLDGVVIWGLQGWKGDGQRCRELVHYAHERRVAVMHGLGLNGYEVGKFIVSESPELAAVIPEHLAGTKKGEWTREAVFCPSKPRSMELLRDCLLRAADTGIDGFNFETADVDYVTCHCPDCRRRFNNADETEHTNKPVDWPIEHLHFAADVLSDAYPKVWLTCEFAMQRFGQKPYTDCARLFEMNRRIDPRITIVWAEATAPPQPIAQKLREERSNIGFYVRSGGIHGWDAQHVLDPRDLLPIARRLLDLDPVCVMYRGYRPLDSWAVNLGAAAGILRAPQMTEGGVGALVARFEALTEPGQAYSFVRHLAPGNLLAPNGPVQLKASSGDPVRLADGVAEPNDGIWRTERSSPAQAWVIAEWPEPVHVDRVRLFHQADGHYRSLDFTVQYESEEQWRDVPGMPVTDNAIYGWHDVRFPAVETTRMRLLITRSKHGNRMGMGEWEVYGPASG